MWVFVGAAMLAAAANANGCHPRTPDELKALSPGQWHGGYQLQNEELCGLTLKKWLIRTPSLLDEPAQWNDLWPELTRQYIAARDNVEGGCPAPCDVELDDVLRLLEEHCQIHSLENDFATSELAAKYLERLAGYNEDMAPVGRVQTCEHCSRPLRKPDVERYESTRGNASWCDIVVVGGYGTGGALQVNRWARAYPDKEVCIVDVGERDIFNSTEWQKCPTCIVDGGSHPNQVPGTELLGNLCDSDPLDAGYTLLALGAIQACLDRVTAHKTKIGTLFSDTGQSFVHEGKTASSATLDEMPIHQPRGAAPGGTSLINGAIHLRPTIHLLREYAGLLGGEYGESEMLRVAKLLENRNSKDYNDFQFFDAARDGLDAQNGFDTRYHSKHPGDIDIMYDLQRGAIREAWDRALEEAFGAERFNGTNLNVHPDVDTGLFEAYMGTPQTTVSQGQLSRCFDRQLGIPSPQFFADDPCTPFEWLAAQQRLVLPKLPNGVGSLLFQPPYGALDPLMVKDLVGTVNINGLTTICLGTYGIDPRCADVTFLLNEAIGTFLPVFSALHPFGLPPRRMDAFSAFLGRHFFYPSGFVAPTQSCGPYCTRVLGTNVRVYERAFATRLVFEDELGDDVPANAQPDPRRVMGIRYYADGRNVNRVGRTRYGDDDVVPRQAVDAEAKRAAAEGESVLLARMETVVATNVFDTPALFQRSGVARTGDLDVIDEPVNRRIDLPGVGHHLHDHADFSVWGENTRNASVPNPPFHIGDSYSVMRIKSSPAKEFANMHAIVGGRGFNVGSYRQREFIPSGQISTVDTRQIPNYRQDEYPSLALDRGIAYAQTSSVFFEQQQSESTGSSIIWTLDPTQPPVVDSSLLKNERDLEDMIDAISTFAIPMFERGLQRTYEEVSPGAINDGVYLPFVTDPLYGTTMTTEIAVPTPESANFFFEYVQPRREEMFTPVRPATVTSLSQTTAPCTGSCISAAVFVSSTVESAIVSATLVLTRRNVTAETCQVVNNEFRLYDEASRTLTLDQTHTCTQVECVETAECDGECDPYGEPVCITKTRVERVQSEEVLDRQKLRVAVNRYKHSGYHATGTMKMGPEEDRQAVTDSCGRVYGLKGVSVADSSVIPISPDVNTMMPTYMFSQRTYEKRCGDYEKYLELEPESGACRECPLDDVTCKQCPGEVPRYTVPGPHAVGYRRTTFVNWNATQAPMAVWYPAKQKGAVRAQYGVFGLGSVAADSYTDAEIVEDEFPVVIFIHGVAANMEPYVRHLEHLASWGIVAVAADFTAHGALESNLPGFNVTVAAARGVQDVDAIYAKVKDGDQGAGDLGDLLEDRIIMDKLIVGGHSLGAIILANLGINTIMPSPQGYYLVSGLGVPGIIMPSVPGLWIHGELDITVPIGPAQALYATTNSDAKTFVNLRRSGHQTPFPGFCSQLRVQSFDIIPAGILPFPGSPSGRDFLDAPAGGILAGLQNRDVFSDGCRNGTLTHDQKFDDMDLVSMRYVHHAITALVKATCGMDEFGAQLGPDMKCFFDDFVASEVVQELTPP